MGQKQMSLMGGQWDPPWEGQDWASPTRTHANICKGLALVGFVAEGGAKVPVPEASCMQGGLQLLIAMQGEEMQACKGPGPGEANLF